jgi:opacity protein-like surface antigen
MDEREANIDLVFRNGLRDYEVLPPPEVWDNIGPVIVKKKGISYQPFLKAAASVAVITSLSLLAYRWGMEASRSRLPDIVALNNEIVSTSVNSLPLAGVEQNIEKGKIIPLQIAVTDIKSDSEAGPLNIDDTVTEQAVIATPKDLPATPLLLPGVQSPYPIKYTRVSSPELEAVTYEFIQENYEMPAMVRWSVSAMASPTYYSQFASSGNYLAQQLMASDQNRVSYTGGVGLSYKISSRVSIQSGLYYSSLGQEVGGIHAYSGFKQYDYSKGGSNFEILTVNGTVHSSNPDIFLNSYNLPERIITNYTNDVFDPVKANLSYVSSTIYQDLSFLELPVMVRYKVVDRKLGLNLIGGISYNFLMGNSVYALQDKGRYPVGTTEGLNTVSVSSSLGMGMEYKLAESLSLNLEPTFRYFINPFNSGQTSGYHPYSIGIFSGLSYKF